MFRLSFLLLMILAVYFPMQAQDDACPLIVETALDTVDRYCSDIERNNLCYGNAMLDITPAVANFDEPGDRIDISEVVSLQLSSMDVVEDVWGVAVMSVQANLPDTFPGQNVTFIMFGDVQIENAVATLPTLDLTTNQGINVRLSPSAEGGLAGSLPGGNAVIANGRYTNIQGEEWIRIYYEQHVNRTGWIIGWALDGEDRETLNLVDPAEHNFNPMQAFSFSTGIGDATCVEAPESGLIIQTPQGAGRVTLSVNGVEVNMWSTVFMQSQPGDAMYVNTLEGRVTLTSAGVSQLVPPGTVARVALDESGQAAGPPEFPQPYNYDLVKGLPVDIVPVVVEVPEPLAADVIEEEIEEAEAQVASGGGTLDDCGCWYHFLPDSVFVQCWTYDWPNGMWPHYSAVPGEEFQKLFIDDQLLLDFDPGMFYDMQTLEGGVSYAGRWVASTGPHTLTATYGENTYTCDFYWE